MLRLLFVFIVYPFRIGRAGSSRLGFHGWYTHQRIIIPQKRTCLQVFFQKVQWEISSTLSLFRNHCNGTWSPAIDQFGTDLPESRSCKKCPIALISKVLLKIRAGFINCLIKPLCLLFVHIGRNNQFSARSAYPIKFGQCLIRIIKQMNNITAITTSKDSSGNGRSRMSAGQISTFE